MSSPSIGNVPTIVVPKYSDKKMYDVATVKDDTGASLQISLDAVEPKTATYSVIITSDTDSTKTKELNTDAGKNSQPKGQSAGVYTQNGVTIVYTRDFLVGNLNVIVIQRDQVVANVSSTSFDKKVDFLKNSESSSFTVTPQSIGEVSLTSSDTKSTLPQSVKVSPNFTLNADSTSDEKMQPFTSWTIGMTTKRFRDIALIKATDANVLIFFNPIWAGTNDRVPQIKEATIMTNILILSPDMTAMYDQIVILVDETKRFHDSQGKFASDDEDPPPLSGSGQQIKNRGLPMVPADMPNSGRRGGRNRRRQFEEYLYEEDDEEEYEYYIDANGRRRQRLKKKSAASPPAAAASPPPAAAAASPPAAQPAASAPWSNPNSLGGVSNNVVNKGSSLASQVAGDATTLAAGAGIGAGLLAAGAGAGTSDLLKSAGSGTTGFLRDAGSGATGLAKDLGSGLYSMASGVGNELADLAKTAASGGPNNGQQQQQQVIGYGANGTPIYAPINAVGPAYISGYSSNISSQLMPSVYNCYGASSSSSTTMDNVVPFPGSTATIALSGGNGSRG